MTAVFTLPRPAWLKPSAVASDAGVPLEDVEAAILCGALVAAIQRQSGPVIADTQQLRSNHGERHPLPVLVGRDAAEVWCAAVRAKRRDADDAAAHRDQITPGVCALARELCGAGVVESSVSAALFERIAQGDLTATCDVRSQPNDQWAHDVPVPAALAWLFASGQQAVSHVEPCSWSGTVWAHSVRVSRADAARLGFVPEPTAVTPRDALIAKVKAVDALDPGALKWPQLFEHEDIGPLCKADNVHSSETLRKALNNCGLPARKKGRRRKKTGP